MKYWEMIADRLHAEGWSYGIAEHFTKHGLLFCVDAHRDGKRFIVKADDLLTAFSFARERTLECHCEVRRAQEIGVCRRRTLTGRSESYGALNVSSTWHTFEFVGISDKGQRRFKHDFWLY